VVLLLPRIGLSQGAARRLRVRHPVPPLAPAWTAVGPFSVAVVGRDEIVVFDIIDAARMPRMPGLPAMQPGAQCRPAPIPTA
jgi:hypothetical protein